MVQLNEERRKCEAAQASEEKKTVELEQCKQELQTTKINYQENRTRLSEAMEKVERFEDGGVHQGNTLTINTVHYLEQKLMDERVKYEDQIRRMQRQILKLQTKTTPSNPKFERDMALELRVKAAEKMLVEQMRMV